MRTAFQAGALAALVSTVLLSPLAASAGPADYVSSPIVEEGEREIDFKAGTAKLPDGSRTSAQSIGFGWGANSWWFTELYAKWHQTPDEGHGFDAWEWENKFQLTETGKYPVDLGFLFEIERPQNRAEGYELSWGPLLQAEVNRVQANLNLLLTKHVRAEESAPAELSYQWQAKYRWQPEFEFGVQGFGSVGNWTDWTPSSEQTHIAGPAAFGRLHVGNHQVITYNAGLLFGLNNASPKTTVRLQAEYEF